MKIRSIQMQAFQDDSYELGDFISFKSHNIIYNEPADRIQLRSRKGYYDNVYLHWKHNFFYNLKNKRQITAGR